MAKRIVILGGGESGAGCGILALKQGFDVFVSEDQYNRKAKALVKFQKSLRPVELPSDCLSYTPVLDENIGSCCSKSAQRFLVLENECSSDVEGLVTASQSNEEETREILSARAETSFGSPLF